MAASKSEEMDQDLEEDALRPSGARLRAVSGPVVRSDIQPIEPATFDDVTPTRSLVEVGLADMDEDLPTRMQSLAEVAPFRTAAASDPGPAPRADVVAPKAPEAVPETAFKSFPAPRPESKPVSVPPTPAVPRDFDDGLPPLIEGLEASAELPEAEIEPERPTADRPTRLLLGASLVLVVAALVALAIDRFVP